MLAIYKQLCYVFLSPNMNRNSISALEAIEELINKRPSDKETIQKVCNDLFDENEVDDDDNEAKDYKNNEEEEDEDIIDVDEDKYCYFKDDESDAEDNNQTNEDMKIDKEKKKQKKKVLNTLKSKSPFMKHFIKIKDDVKVSLDDLMEADDDEEEEENDFYCPEVIQHLENKYLPYCFLWASFTLKNLSLQITRFTNGTIEKKFGTRKSRSKNFMKLNPAQYAIDSEEYSCGLAVQFLNHNKIELEEDKSYSDTDSEFLDDDYQNANLAKEGWNTKPEKKSGCYQQKRSLHFKKYLEKQKGKKQKVENIDEDNNINPKSILKPNSNSKKFRKKELKQKPGN